MRDEGSARREPTGYKVRRALARRQPRPSPRSIREKRTTCRLPLTGSAPYNEAQRRNALLATAVEHAGDAIETTDAPGCFRYVNPAFERISGYTREEAI